MDEIWKPVKGYEGYYEVSNLGNIKRLDTITRYKSSGVRNYPGRMLKQEVILDGYSRVVLMKEGKKKRFMSHRIVAEIFVPNPYNKSFVNHINGDRLDNRAENLEWCTREENERHAVSVLGKSMKGKTRPKMIRCLETNIIYKSMNNCVEHLGDKACISGLNKALDAHRKYHGYTFVRI